MLASEDGNCENGHIWQTSKHMCAVSSHVGFHMTVSPSEWAANLVTGLLSQERVNDQLSDASLPGISIHTVYFWIEIFVRTSALWHWSHYESKGCQPAVITAANLDNVVFQG